MSTGSGSESKSSSSLEPDFNSNRSSNGWVRPRGVVLKSLVLIGGALLLKRLTKSTTSWDHARFVAQSLSGEKFFSWLSCSAAEMVDGGSKVLYLEQAFPRTSYKPYRQRFYMVKPCPKEMKCDVEPSTYAIRDAEEYKNFCDRPKDQCPKPREVIVDIAEHLTTIYLKRCDRGKLCLYEGSTPPDGFPNTWVWAKGGPYEFKPAPASSFDRVFSSLNFHPQPLENRIQGSFVLKE